jgi:phosphohistidine phosphatase
MQIGLKTLYIIRHAKSSWNNPVLDDLERPLNDRGREDAPRMGARLRERNIAADTLITSPATRALSTCEIIADEIGFARDKIRTDERLYHATENVILKIVREQPDTVQQVVLFGHNPGLTDFANRISTNLRLDNLPTCGIVALRFQGTWKEVDWRSGEVLFVDYPKAIL